MEIKEYLIIIKKNIIIFALTVGAVVLSAFLYFYLQPNFYNASLELNITRQGFQKTDNYRFDDYYRLQADELFANTIVEWLRSPVTIDSIEKKAGFSVQKLMAERRSSQLVGVTFSAIGEKEAKRMADSIFETISQNTQNLNEDQKEESWFKIVPGNPSIEKNRYNYEKILAASLFMGVFLGFWIVLIKHYLND